VSSKSLVPLNAYASTTAPSFPTLQAGDLYFNTSSNTLFSYTGSAWVSASGGGVSSITAGTGLSGGTITTSGTIAIDSTVTTLTGTQTLTNKTINGTNNTITNVSLTSGVTGTLPVANGGTGVTTSTGSGANVLSTSPSLTTPSIGVATGTSFNSITGLSSTTPIVDGTAAVGTATTTARADHVHPTDTSRAATSGTLAQFAATTSAQLAGVISDETGSGSLVFATSPTITTPTMSRPVISAQGGAEGGEINLASPVTGTTISGGVNIDIAGNALRFFEAGGTNRGMFVDITTLGAGAGSGIATTTTTQTFSNKTLTSPTLTTPSIGVATGTSLTTTGTITAGGTPPVAGQINSVGSNGGISLALSDNINSSLYVRNASGGAIIGTDGGGTLRLASNGNTTSDVKLTMSSAGAITLTGSINASSSLLWECAGAGAITSRIKTGVYENSAPTVAGGWPETAGWYHLISATHSNTGNYYAAQYASDFFNSENLWYRSTNGGGSTVWNRVLQSTIQRAEKTASYTLIAQDVGRLIEMGVASANTLTVPLNSSVAFPIGAQINILQTGAGQTTIAGAGGVTINGTGTKLRVQWSSATLIKRATDTWVLIGDIS
jgi:hypothetical protein